MNFLGEFGHQSDSDLITIASLSYLDNLIFAATLFLEIGHGFFVATLTTSAQVTEAPHGASPRFTLLERWPENGLEAFGHKVVPPPVINWLYIIPLTIL